MASLTFNAFKKNIMNGTIDLDSDTIKVALVTSSYTPDQDGDEFFDNAGDGHSAIDDEVSGTGYTQGGVALANKAVTQDNTDNEGVFDADDVEWTTATITARAAVIYKDTGTDTTSPLIRYHDFGSDQSTTGTTFKITWAAEGILNTNDP
jgi:hypothetical protein